MKSKSINPTYRQAGAKITKSCKVRKVKTRFSSFLLPLGILIAPVSYWDGTLCLCG